MVISFFIINGLGVFIMLVKELIKELNKMPQDAEVITPSDIWLDLYVGFDTIEEDILDGDTVVILK